MIYTCSFNPSLDYKITLKQLKPYQLNRYDGEIIVPGGKGINNSLLLANLGVTSTAYGFIAGYTGDYLQSLLKQYPLVQVDFIKVKGQTRINFKINIQKKQETELNGVGPQINEVDFQKLIRQVKNLNSKDVLFISGIAPNGIKKAYQKIIQIVQKQKIMLVIDATGNNLKAALKWKPFLIKPNLVELETFVGQKLNNQKNQLKAMKKLLILGAKNVILSLGSNGAMLLNKDKFLKIKKMPSIEIKNTIGAGDSLVAGFIYQYLINQNINEAFYFGVACALGTVGSETIATKKEINIIYQKLQELNLWK